MIYTILGLAVFAAVAYFVGIGILYVGSIVKPILVGLFGKKNKPE